MALAAGISAIIEGIVAAVSEGAGGASLAAAASSGLEAAASSATGGVTGIGSALAEGDIAGAAGIGGRALAGRGLNALQGAITGSPDQGAGSSNQGKTRSGKEYGVTTQGVREAKRLEKKNNTGMRRDQLTNYFRKKNANANRSMIAATKEAELNHAMGQEADRAENEDQALVEAVDEHEQNDFEEADAYIEGQEFEADENIEMEAQDTPEAMIAGGEGASGNSGNSQKPRWKKLKMMKELPVIRSMDTFSYLMYNALCFYTYGIGETGNANSAGKRSNTRYKSWYHRMPYKNEYATLSTLKMKWADKGTVLSSVQRRIPTLFPRKWDGNTFSVGNVFNDSHNNRYAAYTSMRDFSPAGNNYAMFRIKNPKLTITHFIVGSATAGENANQAWPDMILHVATKHPDRHTFEGDAGSENQCLLLGYPFKETQDDAVLFDCHGGIKGLPGYRAYSVGEGRLNIPLKFNHTTSVEFPFVSVGLGQTHNSDVAQDVDHLDDVTPWIDFSQYGQWAPKVSEFVTQLEVKADSVNKALVNVADDGTINSDAYNNGHTGHDLTDNTVSGGLDFSHMSISAECQITFQVEFMRSLPWGDHNINASNPNEGQ